MRRHMPLLALLVPLAACEWGTRDQQLTPRADVSRVEVFAVAGEVSVTADPEVDEVMVSAQLVGDAYFVETREGSTLRVDTTCPRHLFERACRVDYTIVVPPGVELVVDTIEGRVDVYYGATPRSIEVRTHEGDVDLIVPAGPYVLHADSNDGVTSVSPQLEADPNATASIDIQSTLGDIELLADDE